MEAQIQESGDICIVELTGDLSFNSTEPFRTVCFNKFKGKKVVFDLKGLNFVGSSGITDFIEVLRDFSQSNVEKPKFCGLSSEFKKIFEANKMDTISFFETSQEACLSFTEDPLS